jgi:hypothetical protein
MYEVLFIYPKVLARYQAGPAAIAMAKFAARGTLLRIARNCSSSPSGST